MSYKVIIAPQVLGDIKRHLEAGNKKLAVKISSLIDELADHPRSGIGKPEQLKGFTKEIWSRRIDSKHRLIYKIIENELTVLTIAAYGHYGDK